MFELQGRGCLMINPDATTVMARVAQLSYPRTKKPSEETQAAFFVGISEYPTLIAWRLSSP